MCWEAVPEPSRAVAVMARQSLLDPIFESMGFPLGLDMPATSPSGVAHEAQASQDPDICQALQSSLGRSVPMLPLEAHEKTHVSNLVQLSLETATPSPLYINISKGAEQTLM
jgi:hypothetical protein